MRHSMGLADAPPRQPDPDRPDVSAIRGELGLYGGCPGPVLGCSPPGRASQRYHSQF